VIKKSSIKNTKKGMGDPLIVPISTTLLVIGELMLIYFVCFSRYSEKSIGVKTVPKMAP
jgi:hypothetical protein